MTAYGTDVKTKELPLWSQLYPCPKGFESCQMDEICIHTLSQHPIRSECPIQDCLLCAKRDCPHSCSTHYSLGGCGMCVITAVTIEPTWYSPRSFLAKVDPKIRSRAEQEYQKTSINTTEEELVVGYSRDLGLQWDPKRHYHPAYSRFMNVMGAFARSTDLLHAIESTFTILHQFDAFERLVSNWKKLQFGYWVQPTSFPSERFVTPWVPGRMLLAETPVFRSMGRHGLIVDMNTLTTAEQVYYLRNILWNSYYLADTSLSDSDLPS